MPGVTTTRYSTYIGSNGSVTARPSSSRPVAMGGAPANGTRIGDSTVFRNNGGAGSVMDSSGNLRTGTFTFSPFSGESRFIPSR